MRTRDYDVQKRRAIRKATRMRARVMKAFVRMAGAAVAKAAHDASVKFYEAAGVRIRALTPNSSLRGPAAVHEKA
ncbi:MAG TPA: hypothetical protein VH600_10660 [Burkholderiales bacterium]